MDSEIEPSEREAPSAPSTPPRTDPAVLGVTMGDPRGIGAEVLVKALADPEIRALGRFVIYGRNQTMVEAAESAGIAPCWLRVAAESERAARGVAVDPVVFDYPGDDSAIVAPPGPSQTGGAQSKVFVQDAITDALRPIGDPRRIDAIVTGPISKESWSMAGFRWPGHTELLASRTKARRHAMLFWSPRFVVGLATGHCSLMEIRDLLTIGRVFDPIDLAHAFCRQLGTRRPRIAVCGLNPHAGERGLFGDEESRIITPAIELARRHGIDANGPFPGDTIFIDAAKGRWDAVIAMYHDQGLIPIKLLARDSAVNVTVGLPFVRTSPDHGTAFDIAGRNKAEAGSMKAALRLAARLVGAAHPSAAREEPA